ncbi:MAG: iron ABC transporter permease [Sphaerochaeta sp.]|jgi:iron complex transport system permease protein|nr:iron ABC transporter permease [Spirochaetales bacterium]
MEKPEQLTLQYKQYLRSKTLLLVAGLALLLVLSIVAIWIGSIRIPFGAILSSIARFDRSGQGRIVWDVRMPRVLAAIVVGAGLSLSGTVMQSVLRNPLASPYTLGLSSAAAFGASFAIVFLGAGTSTTSTIIVSDFFTVAFSAFLFSVLSTLAILALTLLTEISAQSMVLAGIAIGSIFSAGLTLMQYLANSVQLASIVSWTFGDLGRASWNALAIICAVLIPLSILSFLQRWSFNAMDSGEDTARGLGVHTAALRIGGMFAASIVSAVIVSFFGTIAFIGLLGPHIARRIFGSDHRFLMVASPLIGSIVMLAADTLARTMLSPMVLPVGILTSLLGGPLFIYLLIAGRKR